MQTAADEAKIRSPGRSEAQELKKRRRPRTLPGRPRTAPIGNRVANPALQETHSENNSRSRGHEPASRVVCFKRRMNFSPLWSSVVSAAVPDLSAAVCVSLFSLVSRRSVVPVVPPFRRSALPSSLFADRNSVALTRTSHTSPVQSTVRGFDRSRSLSHGATRT